MAIFPINPVFPGRGKAPLEPQAFYVQTYTITFAGLTTVVGPPIVFDWSVYGPDPLFQTWIKGWNVAQLTYVFPIPPNPPMLWDWGVPPAPAPIDPTWINPPLTLRGPAPAPFNQYDWPNPTPPYRIDQTWTFSYNKNLIGQDKLPVGVMPGEPVYDRPQLLPVPEANLATWIWKYNRNLIGKDQLPVGELVYDLVPAQKAPEQTQLHTWQWSYNLNLIAQDALVTGKQVTDLAPGQVPPRPLDLQTWIWKYNLNLVGKDRLPNRQQDWPNPQPVTWYRDWIIFQLGELELEVPFKQLDWPNPTPPYRLEQTWTATYNKNLVGQDQLPFRQQDWPNPIPPAQVKDWIQSVNLALTSLKVNPFAQTDWPLPIAPPRLDQTIAAFYNPNLVGQDKLPAGKTFYDLPLWIPEPSPRRSWEASYNKNLIGQDQLPFRQQDWPNPIPPAQVKDWIQSVNLALATIVVFPFRQEDWPNPTPPARLDQTFTAFYNRNLIGQDQLPFRQQDWPLTPAAVTILTWISAVNERLIAKPFAQFDWPLSFGPAQPERTITAAYNPNLIGQDRLPTGARNLDLAPVGPLQPDRFVGSSYNKNLIAQDQLPNRQQDWPLSSAHQLAQIPLQIMVAGKGFWLVPPAVLPPGVQYFGIFTDRPQLRTDVPADFYTILPRTPIPPPTPVTSAAVYAKQFLAGPGFLTTIPGDNPPS